MNKTGKIVLLTLGLVFVGMYLLWTMCIMPDKQLHTACTEVEITIEDSVHRHFVRSRDIVQLLEKEHLYPLQKSYADISTQAIEDCIARHPYLKNAECYKTRDGKVRIQVEQRLPVLRVMGEDNYYVDADRKIMPVGSTTAYYVPIVTGHVPCEMVQNELFDFVAFLEDNTFWNAQIKQINVNQRRQVELVPTVGDHLIILGNLQEYERKLDKLYNFYSELNKMGWKDWREIDLRFYGQIVCRY